MTLWAEEPAHPYITYEYPENFNTITINRSFKKRQAEVSHTLTEGSSFYEFKKLDSTIPRYQLGERHSLNACLNAFSSSSGDILLMPVL